MKSPHVFFSGSTHQMESLKLVFPGTFYSSNMPDHVPQVFRFIKLGDAKQAQVSLNYMQCFRRPVVETITTPDKQQIDQVKVVDFTQLVASAETNETPMMIQRDYAESTMIYQSYHFMKFHIQFSSFLWYWVMLLYHGLFDLNYAYKQYLIEPIYNYQVRSYITIHGLYNLQLHNFEQYKAKLLPAVKNKKDECAKLISAAWSKATTFTAYLAYLERVIVINQQTANWLVSFYKNKAPKRYGLVSKYQRRAKEARNKISLLASCDKKTSIQYNVVYQKRKQLKTRNKIEEFLATNHEYWELDKGAPFRPVHKTATLSKQFTFDYMALMSQ